MERLTLPDQECGTAFPWLIAEESGEVVEKTQKAGRPGSHTGPSQLQTNPPGLRLPLLSAKSWRLQCRGLVLFCLVKTQVS